MPAVVRDVDVVVAGAGPGGCVAALLLARLGREVVLLEQAPKTDPPGAGILLQPNGLAVLDAIGLLGQLRDGAGLLRSVRIYDQRGRVLADTDIPDFGHGLDHALVVRRQDLADVLADAVDRRPGIELRRGATVVSASPDGLVSYVVDGDESRLTASLVVGADGIGSAVRRSGGFEARALRLGHRYARAILDGAWDTPGGECWSRLGLMGWASLRDDATYLYLSVTAPEVQVALSNGDLDAFVAAWCDAVPFAAGLVRRLESLGDLVINEAGTVRCATYAKGRAVLVGDAAHAMAPNLGQGANTALVDAVVLVSELAAHSDQDRALDAYDRTRRPAVRKVQRNAERLARLGHIRSPVARAVRDRAVAALSRPRLIKRQARAAQQIEPASIYDLTRRIAPGASDAND